MSQENIDTSFIEDAVSQLLMSRRVLRASYGYGFFLVGSKDKKTPYEQEKKTMFELMQVLFYSRHSSMTDFLQSAAILTWYTFIFDCFQIRTY